MLGINYRRYQYRHLSLSAGIDISGATTCGANTTVSVPVVLTIDVNIWLILISIFAHFSRYASISLSKNTVFTAQNGSIQLVFSTVPGTERGEKRRRVREEEMHFFFRAWDFWEIYSDCYPASTSILVRAYVSNVLIPVYRYRYRKRHLGGRLNSWIFKQIC